MRVCIPTETDQGLHAKLAGHFGTAPFFTIVDLATGVVLVRPNPSCHSRPGQCHHLGLLQSEQVDAVVSSGLGRNAFEALQQAGIKVLLPAGEAVAEVLGALRHGHETPMRTATCGGHHHAAGAHGHCQGHQHQHQHQHHDGKPPC